MTPFEIALSIRKNQDDNPDESAESFVLRALADETMADFGAALELLIGWERADEDFVALLECLKIGGKDGTLPISELIKKRRSLIYDPKLESLLARRWRCPHCKQLSGIASVQVNISKPGSLLGCLTCGEVGMYPVEPRAQIKAHDGGKKGLRLL